VQRLVRAGVEVHTCDVGNIKNELDITLIIRAWQGGAEHAKIRERTWRGKIGKAQSGRWMGGTPPYGYQQAGYKHAARLVPYEPEAEVVRTVYRWYTQERLPMLAIAERLNRQGIPTRKGTQWWKAMVKRLIDNSTYMGVVYFTDIRIDLPEIAIIDPATFEAAQRQREHNREFSMRNRKHNYLLSNHFRCACGETLVGSTQSNKYQRYYYRCSQFQQPPSKHDCPLDVPNVNGLVADGLVWDFIRNLIKDDNLLRASLSEVSAAREQTNVSLTAHLAELDAEIAAANRKIATLVHNFGDDDDEEVAKAMKATVRETQRAREEARVKRAVLASEAAETTRQRQEQTDILARVAGWRGDIDHADFVFKREVLEILDVRVILRVDAAGNLVLGVASRANLEKPIPYMRAPDYKRMLHTRKAVAE
jgi:site-specific DNA recombinase